MENKILKVGWLFYGISKKINNETIEIDLHWHLSNTRDKLLILRNFGKKKTVSIDGMKLFTLNNYDNFLHLCIHAAKDRWMNQVISRNFLSFKETIRNKYKKP